MPDTLHVDVAVIGGGIGGISVASELALDRSVVMIEAEREPGLHATGRSAASYVPNYGPPTVRPTAASLADFDTLSEEFGRPLLIERRCSTSPALRWSPRSTGSSIFSAA